MNKNNIDLFIKRIPKAELHLHIEGTLEPELMFEMAKRNRVHLLYQSINEVKEAYDFHSLQSFLDIYYEATKVLVTEKDFYDLTWAYLEKIHQENVIHTEIFFDPQTHTERGIPFQYIVNGIYNALQEGKKKFGISSCMIMCFLRHLSPESAMETLEKSLSFKDKIIGVGLDSSEANHPPSKFKEVFLKAISHGYLPVAHAGEEGPPEYIWEALNELKVLRIDHGIRSVEDEKLVLEIVNKKIPLTVCPLSNVKLKVFQKIEDHNLKKLLDLGINATVNSDDPAYFGGYMVDNFIAVQKALNLDESDIYKLVKNSFNASFVSDNEKKNLINKLDSFIKNYHQELLSYN